MILTAPFLQGQSVTLSPSLFIAPSQRCLWAPLRSPPTPVPTSRSFCSSCTPALPSSSHALSGVSTLGCPSLAGPCGPLLSEPLPPALAYLTVSLGRNIRALPGWTLVVIPRVTVQKRQLRGAPGCHRKSVAGPGEVGLNTDSSVGGLFGRHTITDRQLCEGGHQARLDGLRETRGPKQGWWPWPEEGLCLPAIASTCRASSSGW